LFVVPPSGGKEAHAFRLKAELPPVFVRSTAFRRFSESKFRLKAELRALAEFEERSLGYGELVIRMNYKDLAKGIRISLAGGKIVMELVCGAS